MKKQPEKLKRKDLKKILDKQNILLEKMKLEIKIEASLEAVRAVSLLMKKREDMLQVCTIIAKQLILLDVKEIRNVQTAIFYKDKGTYINYEYYAKHDKTFITETEYTNHKIQQDFADKMLKGSGEFMEAHIKGDEVKEWIAYQKTTNVFIDDYLNTASSVNYYWFSLGPVALGISTYSPLNKKEINLFNRFLKVFELSYTRYLDIEKAEAQTRENQIQLALERVRARTMAMQHSTELTDVAAILFKQVNELGIKPWTTGFNIWSDDNNFYEDYIVSPEGDFIDPYTIDTSTFSVFAEVSEAKKNGQDFLVQYVEGNLLKETYKRLSEFANKNQFENILESGFEFPTHQYDHFVFGAKASLMFITYEPVPEAHDIFKRFGQAFDQTYTRFNDLQKAEAQAREAQIEAALERVRTKAMSMYSSKDMLSVTHVLRTQMTLLDQKELESILIHIYTEKSDSFEAWFSYRHLDDPNGSIVDGQTTLNWSKTRRASKDKEKYYSTEKDYTIVADYAMLKEWYAYLDMVVPEVVEHDGQGKILVPDVLYYNYSKFEGGALLLITTHEASEDSKYLLRRSAEVFNLAYTRFLDLQKAEAQAREAQIELSLERVRAKTMAMHNSRDVGETAAVMVDELKKLGIETIRFGIVIMHEPGDMEVWTIRTDENNKTDIIIGWVDMNMHPLLHGAFDSWRNKMEAFSYELKDDDLLNYFNAINNYPGYPIRYDTSVLPKQIHHNEFHFAEGTLFAFSLQQLTDEQRKIFKRFAGVFGQTYRRYLDLKKVEAQAREAQIEVALERVRSRTLAMQKSDELAETAAVVFRELIGLGIEPNRLYITIIKDNSGDMEFWITDEDGTKVGNKFSGNAHRNISFQKMYDGWEAHKKSITIDMHGNELTEYFNHLNSLGVPFKLGLEQKRRFQNIAYFSKGFIGMASPEEQPEETISLLERFAAVFNLTYTRFNDLQIAEHHAEQAEIDLQKLKEEKKRTEEALTELQATQKQLIQSEKMASLGELTAGIAHEIQNPLNFVNNFSEVNKELLAEMKDEMDKGNTEDAKAIANDVIENEQKINHHGKRADAIVKGMLQHSRSSSNTKELTDINALADEYLRLAYHGLRAKDNSFNATMKTDFDNAINKINIVPQDIGRVLLNLYTNAFYAVNDKKKMADENYQPTISVETKKMNNNIEIKVSDNGNGIPSTIINKIFQPFFTTKPTGQGTGLGLSLSYDIIKAHSGEIKVETKEGEGTEFVIQIPK